MSIFDSGILFSAIVSVLVFLLTLFLGGKNKNKEISPEIAKYKRKLMSNIGKFSICFLVIIIYFYSLIILAYLNKWDSDILGIHDGGIVSSVKLWPSSLSKIIQNTYGTETINTKKKLVVFCNVVEGSTYREYEQDQETDIFWSNYLTMPNKYEFDYWQVDENLDKYPDGFVIVMNTDRKIKAFFKETTEPMSPQSSD